jgi:hypothetical protein
MNDTERMYPLAEPDKETAADNPAFVSACLARVAVIAARTGERFGNYVLTYSDIWGFVFRIDMLIESEIQYPSLAQRYICWSGDQDDSIAGAASVYVNPWTPPEGF